jgi:CheY-like chemotaxis protein
MDTTPVNPRILIVDDNPKNLQVLGKNLQLEKFDIEFAINGASTFEWLEATPFDLILLDVNMPGMNGFEVCKRIRSYPRFDNLPILFITADNDKESIVKGFEAGGQDYITKPFDVRELIMRVKTHLTLKTSLEKLAELNSMLEERVKDRTSQLNRAKEKAEESNRLKTAFLHNLSHELRTPMNGILGFLDLLRRPELDEEKKEKYIDIVQKSGQRLLNTVNDIVEIARIEAGEDQLYLTNFNLVETMNYLYDYFKPFADEKHLTLTYVQGLNTGNCVIRSDSQKVSGILTNLINNAIKFTVKGFVEFGYHVDNKSLILWVKDTGVGIPADRRDAVFERFVQADLNITRGYEGLGLGLSIVKAHVDSLGGAIDLISEQTKGTEFRVAIPYNPVQGQHSPSVQPDKEDGTPSGSLTILVVDDDEINLHYVDNLLEGEDFTLVKALSGEEAIHAVKNNPEISIVLMDLKMPGMNGLEATAEIRKFNKTIPIVAQTAYAMSGDMEKALNAGCNDYLSKPLRQRALLRVIRKYT